MEETFNRDSQAKAMSHLVTLDPLNPAGPTLRVPSAERALLQCLPFAGLGFDLRPVMQRAAFMLLTPCVVDTPGRASGSALEAPVSGFLLQLWLGRQTRAG